MCTTHTFRELVRGRRYCRFSSVHFFWMLLCFFFLLTSIGCVLHIYVYCTHIPRVCSWSPLLLVIYPLYVFWFLVGRIFHVFFWFTSQHGGVSHVYLFYKYISSGLKKKSPVFSWTHHTLFSLVTFLALSVSLSRLSFSLACSLSFCFSLSLSLSLSLALSLSLLLSLSLALSLSLSLSLSDAR